MAETEQINVTFQDDDSAAAIAQKLVSALDSAFAKSTGKLGDRLEKIFTGGTQGAKRFERETRSALDAAEAGFRKAERQADAFQKTMQGISRTSAKSGGILDPDVFDASARSFNNLDDNIRRVINNFDKLSTNRGGREVLTNLTSAIRSQANQANVAQQSITRIAEQGSKARADAARVAQQRVTALEVSGSKERIVAAQQEGARSLAATRAASQQRIEIFRAAVNQIRALERGLGSVFSGTARTLTSAFSGIGSALTSVLGRGNRQMTQGIQGAVNQRTSIIQRAFRTQESVIRSSVTNQSRTLAGLDRQLSTGIAGAVSGRSAAANALGFGGAALGGIGLVKVLKDGLTAGADFTQGLAVLDAQLQLTDAQLAAVRQTSLDLGNDISLPGVSALDAAQAIGLLSKQFGALGDQATPAATAAAKAVLSLSRATNASAEDSAQIVGAAVNVFGIAADKAGLVSDKVATALSKAAGTSSNEFAQAFRQGASVFNLFQGQALGAEGALSQFNAALAILAREGIVGSDAGTSLKQFFLQGTRQAADAVELSKELTSSIGETGNVFYTAEGGSRALSDSIEILRKATAGMSEEQRNAALATLFGSDAVRAANALIGTTAEEYDALIASMERQGTAAELAAAQNQGLRGAMDALGSTIETQLILAYESVQIAAGNALLVVANFANNLATGEGIYATIRTGLKGVAIALGGLIAAKGAIEVLGLLRVALGALLTPMGALIAIAVGLGAGLAILYKRSAEVRAIFDEVKAGFTAMINAFKANDPDQTSKGFAGFMERIGTQARIAFNFIGDELIPRIVDVANTVKENLVGVFTGSGKDDDLVSAMFGIDSRNVGEKVGDRIRELVGPVTNAVKTGYNFVRDAITGSDKDDLFIMALTGSDTRTGGERLGDRIREIFFTARDAIVSFARTVADVLSPVTDAIGDLASAIVDIAKANPAAVFGSLGAGLAGALGGFAIGGPLGAVIGGLGAGVGTAFATGLGDEIVQGLSNIGGLIVDGLQAGVGAIGGALGKIFTVEKIFNFTVFASEMAQKLGRVIGTALSDPRVVAGVAGAAGAIALIAGRFVLGLGQGIISNVPELASMIGDALEAALRAAIGALSSLSGSTIATALAGLFLARGALTAFRAAGTGMGNEVKTGMLATFRSNAFGGAFAGGGAAVRGGAAGSFFTSLIGGPDALGTAIRNQATRAATVAQRETTKLNTILSAAGRGVTPGLNSQSGFAEQVRKQYGQLVTDVGASGVLGLKLRTGIQAGINSLRSLSLSPFKQFLNDMGVQGLALAKQVGAKVAAGVAGGVAGFQVGRAVGGQSFGEQALAIGGTAAAIGAINPAAGVAAAGLGILGAAMGNAAARATETKARIEGLTSAISQSVGVGDRIRTVGKELQAAFENIFDQGEIEGLLDKGFDIGKFTERIVDGTTTIRAEFDRLVGSVGPAGRAFVDSLDPAITSVGDLKFALTEGYGQNSALREELNSIGIEGGDARDVVSFLAQAVNDYNSAAAGASSGTSLAEQIDAVATSAEGAYGSLQKLNPDVFQRPGASQTAQIEATIQAVTDKANVAAEAFAAAQAAADEWLNGDYQGTLQSAVDDLFVSLPGIQTQIEGLAELPAGIRDSVQRGIGDDIQVDLRAIIKTGLETGEITNVGEYLEGLRAKVAELTATGQIPAEAGMNVIAQIDSLLLDPNFITQMTELISGLPPVAATAAVEVTPEVTVDTAAMAAAVAAAISGGAGAGGPEGFGRGPSVLGGGAATKTTVAVDIELAPNVTVAASGAAGAAIAGAGLAAAAARGAIGALGQVVSAARVVVTAGALAMIGAASAGTAGGLRLAAAFAAGIRGGTGAAVGAARSLGAAASSAVATSTGSAFSAGANLGNALASGIRSSTGAAVGAARAMASAVAAASRTTLGISSPSKVFMTIGNQIGQGIAQGIADSEDDISNVAKNVIDGVVKAAGSRAEQISAASASLFDLMLPQGNNGVTTSAVLKQRAGLTMLATSLQSVFDDAAKELWDSVSNPQNANQRLIQAQFTGYGLSYNSLNANTALGSQNVTGFISVAEKVRDFISDTIASGGDIGNTVNQARDYVNQIRQVSAQYSVSSEEVEQLLSQLGLSDEALERFRQQAIALQAEAAQVRAKTLDGKETEQTAAEKARDDEARKREETNQKLMLELLRIAVNRPTDISVSVPYGDPEAIALAVANRAAYDLNINT